ncbi:MAG: response regulator [archaeon]
MYPSREEIERELGERKELTNKVLLVDDDPDIVFAIQTALTDYVSQGRYEVLTAGDGLNALDIFAGKRPRVMVLDIMLPQMSGFLVMEKIRAEVPEEQRPRTIIITANEGRRHKQYALAMGVREEDYLTKPFELAQLVERVHAYI